MASDSEDSKRSTELMELAPDHFDSVRDDPELATIALPLPDDAPASPEDATVVPESDEATDELPTTLGKAAKLHDARTTFGKPVVSNTIAQAFEHALGDDALETAEVSVPGLQKGGRPSDGDDDDEGEELATVEGLEAVPRSARSSDAPVGAALVSDEFSDSSAKEPEPRSPQPPTRGATFLSRPGSNFGKYHLLAKVASGNHAEIHLASRRHDDSDATETLDPMVCVVKRLSQSALTNDSVRAAFEAEGNLHASLSHRNIVEFLDRGEVAGRPFIAFEFVDGLTLDHLDTLASPQMLPVSVVLEIGVGVSEALAYAHTAEGPNGEPLAVVHNDVIPANILLSRDGEVKLSDFGVADFARQTAAASPATENERAGHVAYMSPEQAQRGSTDGRSDIFSLGVILVELLSGAGLFVNGVDSVADPAARVASRLADRSGLPLQLISLLRKMTTINPADRPASAKEVASLLGTMLEISRRGLTLREYIRQTIVEHVPRVNDPAFGALVTHLRKAAEDRIARQRAYIQSLDGKHDSTVAPDGFEFVTSAPDDARYTGHPNTVGVLLDDVVDEPGGFWSTFEDRDKPKPRPATTAALGVRHKTFLKGVQDCIDALYGEDAGAPTSIGQGVTPRGPEEPEELKTLGPGSAPPARKKAVRVDRQTRVGGTARRASPAKTYLAALALVLALAGLVVAILMLQFSSGR